MTVRSTNCLSTRWTPRATVVLARARMFYGYLIHIAQRTARRSGDRQPYYVNRANQSIHCLPRRGLGLPASAQILGTSSFRLYRKSSTFVWRKSLRPTAARHIKVAGAQTSLTVQRLAAVDALLSGTVDHTAPVSWHAILSVRLPPQPTTAD